MVGGVVTSSTLKEFITDLAGAKAPGPNTTFTVFHIFYALELLSEQVLGRNKLAQKLHVGEGAIRTIINRLKDADLITTSKEGCRLTEKGREIWKQFEDVFPKRVEIERSDLSTADYNYAFLVKDRGHKVKSVIDHRDAAIVAGAKKATVMIYKNGHLSIEPFSEQIEKEFPEAAERILRRLEPQNNDVIITAGGDTPLKAKRGAFASSWSLLN
jgi:predicted transcriptional regulator